MQLNFISGKILSDVECCICYSTKCSKSGYEKLVKCTTEKAALSLQQCATQKNDNPRLLASVAGLEVQNIVAYELHYHRTCQREYTRPNKSLGGNVKLDDAALKELYGVVTETVIEQGKVMFTEEFRSIYETHCQDKNAVPNRRTLLDLVLQTFQDEIESWVPKHGMLFIFNAQIPKGQIIEILMQKHRTAEEKNKQPSVEEKVKEVAILLRNEIQSVPLTYEYWPPDETTLLEKITEHPPFLSQFLNTLLTTRYSKNSRRKARVIHSLIQDIIYNVTNGNHRTAKHVIFSLCAKRKTGSKQLISWLNRFGHGISYDEVNYLETFLAEEAIKNQSVRSYCPASVQPSVFVTFVWDNNDINPETLTGVSMHCTNGIIVQLSQHSQENRREVRRQISDTSHERKRSFKALPNMLDFYVSKKREDPKHLTDIDLESKECDGMLPSSVIDFLWTLLRSKFIVDGNEQRIPNWTGFNYMIEKDNGAPIHAITYLPAIDQSPTKMETVLEVLCQSKSKAETLGLTETDVVMDQAIYAKVISNTLIKGIIFRGYLILGF